MGELETFGIKLDIKTLWAISLLQKSWEKSIFDEGALYL